VTAASSKSMMILIAGPYRSVTNDDPSLIRKNVEELESYALPIFRAGHIPILGEWLALPLVELAGSEKIGARASTKSFIRSRSDFWKSAMQYFVWGDLQREPMRWCRSAGVLD
jgi:hypothetical protein